MIAACVVLHNIIPDRGDVIDEEGIPLPAAEDAQPAGPLGGRGNLDAQIVRDALAQHCFWHC
jgi:hypothetical protein